MPASAPAPVAGKHLAYITEKEAKLLEVLNLHDSSQGNDFKYQPPGGQPQEEFVLANKKEQNTLKGKGASGKKTAAGVKSFFMETTGGVKGGTTGIGTGTGGKSGAGATGTGGQGTMNDSREANNSSDSKSKDSQGSDSRDNGSRAGVGANKDNNTPSTQGSPGRDNGMRDAPGANAPGKTPAGGRPGEGGMRDKVGANVPNTVSGPGKTDRLAGPRTDRMPTPSRNVTDIAKTPDPNVTNINKTPGVGQPLSQQPYADFKAPKSRVPTAPDPAQKVGVVDAPRLSLDPTNGVGRFSRLANAGLVPDPIGFNHLVNPGTDPTNGIGSTPVSPLSNLATVNAPRTDRMPTSPLKDLSRLPQSPDAPGQVTARYPGRNITVAAQNINNVPRTDRQPSTGTDVSQAQVDRENAALAAANQVSGPMAPDRPTKDPSRLSQSNAADPNQVSRISETLPGEGNITQATYNPPVSPGSGLRPGETVASSQLATSFLNNQGLTNPGALPDASGGGGNIPAFTSDLPPIVPPPVVPPAVEPPPVDPLPPNPPVIGGPPVLGGGGQGTTSGGVGAQVPTVDPPPPPTDPGPGIVDPYAGIMPWDREAYASLQAIMQTMGVTYTPDQFVQQFYQQGNEAAPPPINYVRPKVQPIPVESGQPLVQQQG